jgi:hypothetical protein
MLHTRAEFLADAVRSFAKAAKSESFLSGAIAKAAIGKDKDVAASFVSAFAPLVHRPGVQVANVSILPHTTGRSRTRDLKHDIALRYSFSGAGTLGTAVIDVVPQGYNRTLANIPLQFERYLSGHSLAHASGHYLAAVHGAAKSVKAERLTAKQQQIEDMHAGKSDRREHGSPVHTAYVRSDPVHLLMLNEFCHAHDTKENEWRVIKTLDGSVGGKYGWLSPLFSTFRLTSEAASVVEDQVPNSIASSLRDRLSITTVHLPMVPLALNDMAAWDKVVTLPEHRLALQSAELREWLHYLAHTHMSGGTVVMPLELRDRSIFRKSAEMAEEVVRGTRGKLSYSEKEVADFALQAKRDQEDAVRKEREAAAAALTIEREAAAVREATLLAEIERLKKSGSGSS